MKKFVLASHGNLAAGMKSSLEMINGTRDDVIAICAYMPDSPDLKETLKGLVAELGEGDELIIITDVLGGSVNTEASQFRDIPGVYVVTGMNLGLVISLVLGGAPTTDELIEESLASAREQLMRIQPSEINEDEDF